MGLLGIECKCGFVYCNAHRLPENHSCEFNHKERAKEKMKMEIVKVMQGKVEKI